jgi:hypothetical protein
MKRTIIFLWFFWASSTWAHPVPYRYAIGVMSWNQPFMSETWVTYTFLPDMAIAARMNRFVMQNGMVANFYSPQLDYLVKRWNGDNYQGNIYVYGGLGSYNFDGMSGHQYYGAVEADWETRKYFVLGRWESGRGNIGPDMHKGEFRLGIAPYEAAYEELASWLMVQIQYHPGMYRHYAITPLGRFFYKSVLWELGVSTDGDYMLNLMFHL